MTIAPATAEEAPVILQLIRELADHEGERLPGALTERALRAMLAPPHRLHVLVARGGDGRPLGYVSYMCRFSAWEASEYLGVDDLFVREEARGRGVGKALMLQIACIARERGQTVRWEAKADNRAAQAFYRRLGARLSQKIVCRWTP